MALLHKLGCPSTLPASLWEHAASGRTPPRWTHGAAGWREAGALGDYLGAAVTLHPPLLPAGEWEVVDHRWSSTSAASGTQHVPQDDPAVLGGCEPYCTEPCSALNGASLVEECGACKGRSFACRPGAEGFTSMETTREDRGATRRSDRCDEMPHALRWLLGRLLSPDPALRGPPGRLLVALEKLHLLERGARACPSCASCVGLLLLRIATCALAEVV